MGDDEADGESSDEEGTSEEATVSDEETEEVAERKGNASGGTSSREGIDWEALTVEQQQQQQRQPKRVRGSLGILRLPQTELSRVFQSISLDSFTLLSSGTTSKL